MMRRRDVLIGAAALAGCASGAAPTLLPGVARPLIIAHRGASGERPEHTMAAYRRAVEQGADYIEPDLVLTKDGHFVCRHENEISQTTDIADRPEFADRRATKRIDGGDVTGWFTEDFTLEELRTLRCKERLPQLRPANAAFDGQEQIPTFQDVFEFARDESQRLRRTVGLYPELKHPSHFASLGLPMPDAMRTFLESNNLNRREAPVFVQCFEEFALRSLRLQGVRTRLIFLCSATGGPYDQILARRPRTYADYLEFGLGDIREFADGVGVEKTLIIPRDESGHSAAPTDLVARAHAARLLVHAWTFRAENHFLPAELRIGDPAASPDYERRLGDAAAELRAFAQLGVDGLFTDHPGIAVSAFA